MNKTWKQLLGLAVLLALVLSLAPLALAAENGSYEYLAGINLPEVNEPDTIPGSKFTVIPVGSEEAQSFSYGIPEDGAAVLIFFNTTCGNCRAFFSGLDEAAWAKAPRINLVAVESNGHTSQETIEFLESYCPRNGAYVNCYYGNGNLQFNYAGLITGEYGSLTWPVIAVITQGESGPEIRFGNTAVYDMRMLENSLLHLFPDLLEANQPDSGEGHQHSYEAFDFLPTCTEEGYTIHICGCDDYYFTNIQAALGHDYQLVNQKDATTAQDGYTGDLVCSRCEDTILGEVIPALGEETPEPTEPEPEKPAFTDLEPGAFYIDAVNWAVGKGITSGISDTSFAPLNACTRAQVVTFLWRAEGKPAPESTENPFTDLIPGEFYYDAVLWAVENQITNGMGDGTFGTLNTVTRGQFVTFLWRALGKPGVSRDNPFYDVPNGEYYTQPILWALDTGVTTGTSGTTFGPEDPCNRGQVVTFLYRAYGKMPEDSTPVVPDEPAEPQDDTSYFYKTLSEQEQELYRGIYEGLSRMDETISDLWAQDTETLKDIYYMVVDDSPELFWAKKGFGGSYWPEDSGIRVTITPKYNCTASERDAQQQAIDKATAEILSQLRNASDYEKAKGVHDFVINLTTYDQTREHRTIYDLLVNGTSVCEGYARATQYLLKKLGVECLYVTGSAAGGLHAWNIVKINGEYYQLDNTWDDPASSDGTHILGYNYFLITTEEMSRDHTQDPLGYPNCTSKTYNYYVQEGKYLEAYNRERLKEIYEKAFRESIGEAEVTVEFRCVSEAVYQETLYMLFTERNNWGIANEVAETTGQNPTSCRYSKYEEHYTLKIKFSLDQTGESRSLGIPDVLNLPNVRFGTDPKPDHT